MTRPRRSQEQRRRESRHAITHAAMRLVADGEPFEAVTIRELAAHSGLAPSGFYRYFADMAALEQAIVEEAFGSVDGLVEALASARDGTSRMPGARLDSLSTLIGEHRLPLAFLARQRIAGGRGTRQNIRAKIRAATRQVAARLAGHPAFEGWLPDDVMVLAEMMVQVFLQSVDNYLTSVDPATGTPDAATCQEIDTRARAQMRLLVAAARAWQPRQRGDEDRDG